MQIGRLRHKVTIMRVTKTPDGKGGFTRTWAAGENVWADVVPSSSRERFYAGQVDADATHKVTIRQTPNIDIEDIILLGARNLHVVGLRNIEERNRMIELRCKEEQP